MSLKFRLNAASDVQRVGRIAFSTMQKVRIAW